VRQLSWEPWGLLGRLEVMGVERAPDRVAVRSPAAAGFAEFYRAEYPRTLRFAWLLTHSPAASEDLTQEAFTAVYRRFGELDSQVAYLRRVLVNLSRTWHRNESSVRRRVLRLREEPCETPVPDPHLVAAVRRLPHRQRVVIVARYWADWSEADIAGALGCRPGTVKSLASRALDQLREEVGHHDR
jgi:RNA polymerase sigma-70 factor (sigma-E family)